MLSLKGPSHDVTDVVPRREAESRAITVGLVNNMPGAAFLDTEQQFRRALGVGPDGGGGVVLELYTMSEAPRSARARELIGRRYRGLRELWDSPPDALIVTGTEPVEEHLQEEPYWPSLVRLLEWASSAVPTVLLSCLAAHAALLTFDGIERVRRDTKCSGVFPGCVCDTSDPLAQDLPDYVFVPHSRVNDIPQTAIVNAGYRIIVGSAVPSVGWAVATRECGDSLFVLCQGHPEYSTLSLLREYRRDVRRFLSGRRPAPYPRLPEGYLSGDGIGTFEAFARRVTRSVEDPRALWDQFPYDEVAGTVQNTWAGGSAVLYANWLRAARRLSALSV